MTTTKETDLRQVLNSGNDNHVAEALKKIKAGNMASVIRVVVASLTATAAPNITSAAVKAAATSILGITLDEGENLPAIGVVVALQLVASGTAASLGTYIVGPTGTPPAGATPLVPPGGAQAAVGIASLSDNGEVLTFPNTITGFSLTYIPRPFVALNTSYQFGAP